MHEPDICHPVCQVIARLGTLCKTAAVGTGVCKQCHLLYDDVELNTGCQVSMMMIILKTMMA